MVTQHPLGFQKRHIFVRLAEPDWHREAITSRPLLLHAIAERVRYERQTTIKIASTHARSVSAAEALRAVTSGAIVGMQARVEVVHGAGKVGEMRNIAFERADSF